MHPAEEIQAILCNKLWKDDGHYVSVKNIK